MKLLIITQKVDKNDSILGFFHRWILEFAKKCESVVVICLYEGEHDLPANVRVLSLGKDKSSSKIKYLWNFYRYIWQERNNYGTVFVHMNAEYVIGGGLFWRLFKKKIGLWYAHKVVGGKLRLAAALTDVIFTASPESFGLLSAKVKVIGHGIDVDKFTPPVEAKATKAETEILCVGRISRIKNQLLLIEAADIIVNQRGLRNIKLGFIGSAQNDRDKNYQWQLAEAMEKFKLQDSVRFVGNVRQKDLPAYYQAADLSVNLCPTGGLDKVVLESMACGVPALAYNKTFVEIFGAYKDRLIIDSGSKEEVAEKIEQLLKLESDDKSDMSRDLREIVVNNHGVGGLIGKILKIYENQE